MGPVPQQCPRLDCERAAAYWAKALCRRRFIRSEPRSTLPPRQIQFCRRRPRPCQEATKRGRRRLPLFSPFSSLLFTRAAAENRLDRPRGRRGTIRGRRGDLAGGSFLPSGGVAAAASVVGLRHLADRQTEARERSSQKAARGPLACGSTNAQNKQPPRCPLVRGQIWQGN